MSHELDRELDAVFAAARRAFPDEIEPSAEFMPSIWRRIEEARTVSWLAVLRRWSPRLVATASAATAALALAVALGQKPAESGNESPSRLWAVCGFESHRPNQRVVELLRNRRVEVTWGP